MTNFLIAAVVICLAAAVVCLAAIAWLLICIQETLSKIYKECWVSRLNYREFWEKNLSGPSHACDSKRMWIRRSLERECYLRWDLGPGNGSGKITDLGGSICQVMTGTDVNAKED